MRSLRQSFRVSSLAAACVALFALVACGSSDDRDPDADETVEPNEPVDPPSLRFRTGPDIVLRPRGERRIEVQVTPAGAHSIEFALIPDPNAPDDAVLDRNRALSDADGIARVTLTAPSTSAVLSLRASLGSQAVYASIRVVGDAFGALRVHPSYAGQRVATSWVASVHLERRCEDLAGTPTDDGDLIGVSTTDTIEIGSVPITPLLAVTLRSGRFLSGCLTLDDALEEGETRTQFVPVSAIPLRLESSVLDLAVALEPADPALNELLDASLADGLLALRRSDPELPAAPDDLAALLDAMQASLFGHEAAFESARASESWDELLADALDDPERSRLGESLARWTRIGRSALLSSRAFEGRLQSSPSVPGHARFTVDRVAGIGAEQAGVGTEEPWSWEADAVDRIGLGGVVYWTPSKFSAALSIAPALAETGALTMVDALTRVYDCALVGRTLDDASPEPGAPGTSCDAACLETLCRTALATLWDRVRLFSGSELERLAFTAVGAASVGNEAEAVALEGRWVGRFERSGQATGGALRGWAPRWRQ